MEECLAHCGQYHPQAGAFLGCVRQLAEQKLGLKPVSSDPLFLLQTPALASLDDRQHPRSVNINPVLPGLLNVSVYHRTEASSPEQLGTTCFMQNAHVTLWLRPAEPFPTLSGSVWGLCC